MTVFPGIEVRQVAGSGDDPRLWVRMAGDLRGKLAAGVITAGETISITRLSADWGVTRQTVSKALRALEADGLVRRYPAVGYRVQPARDLNEHPNGRKKSMQPGNHDGLSAFERPGLERLKLAADVILGEGEGIGDVLAAELVLFRDRVERTLLLPSRGER
jgi:biotin operon repressor